MIDKFQGQYRFLSNFYCGLIKINGIVFSNAESAFQAQKTLDEGERLNFRDLPPNTAKSLGRKVKLRSDWETVKDGIMEDIIRTKFQVEPLRTALINTGNEKLVEGNTWHDTYWGICNGVGQNRLGKILMKIRDELRNS